MRKGIFSTTDLGTSRLREKLNNHALCSCNFYDASGALRNSIVGFIITLPESENILEDFALLSEVLRNRFPSVLANIKEFSSSTCLAYRAFNGNRRSSKIDICVLVFNESGEPFPNSAEIALLTTFYLTNVPTTPNTYLSYINMLSNQNVSLRTLREVDSKNYPICGLPRIHEPGVYITRHILHWYE